MQKKQIILAIIALCLILLAFLGFIFQDQLQEFIKPKQEEQQVSLVSVIAQDTIPYKEYLKKELGVIETKKFKRAKREVWRLGKGPSIINYLLKAQNHIRSYEGSILEMEQTFNQASDKNGVFQSATLDFLDFKGDTINVELQITREIFVEGSSKISIVFQASNLSEENFESLGKQEYPFTVLLTPWEIYPDTTAIRLEKLKTITYKNRGKKGSDIQRMLREEMLRFNEKLAIRKSYIEDLRYNPNVSFVVWPFLESTKLNSTHSHPIRIHHTREEIKTAVREAFELIPDAKGMATRLGEQAVEHKNLLSALLEPLQGKHQFFLDLTGTNPSETNNVCAELSITCETFLPYNPDNSTLEFYIKKTLNEARKYGSTVMILPMKKDVWSYLQNIKETASRQGTEIIPLTELIDLRQ